MVMLSLQLNINPKNGRELSVLISERIFEKLNDIGMTQKEFCRRTGILQSTVSEWKKRHTNPSSDKIMVICSVLDVSPEWLLSGTEVKSGYRNQVDWYVLDKESEAGLIVTAYNKLDAKSRARVAGYLDALCEVSEEEKKE